MSAFRAMMAAILLLSSPLAAANDSARHPILKLKPAYLNSGGSGAQAMLPPGSPPPKPDFNLLTVTTGPKTVDRPYAYIEPTALWTFPAGQPKVIPVCWETPGYTAEKKIVQDAVTTTWQAASGLRFVGWQNTCQDGFQGIRIEVVDDADNGPRTLGLGTQVSGVVHGMLLNFTFDKWGTGCASTRASCIASIAVHEFGHAIGFAHEQNRPDAPGECQTLAQGPNGTLQLTPFDPSSVMNYCNSKYNNDGHLSDLDKKAVALMYCKPSDPNCVPAMRTASL